MSYNNITKPNVGITPLVAPIAQAGSITVHDIPSQYSNLSHGGYQTFETLGTDLVDPNPGELYYLSLEKRQAGMLCYVHDAGTGTPRWYYLSDGVTIPLRAGSTDRYTERDDDPDSTWAAELGRSNLDWIEFSSGGGGGDPVGAGSILSVSVVAGSEGTGYVTGEEVTFTSPMGGSGINFTGIITETGGVVSNVAVGTPGLGYLEGEILTYNDGSTGGLGLQVQVESIIPYASTVEMEFPAIVVGDNQTITTTVATGDTEVDFVAEVELTIELNGVRLKKGLAADVSAEVTWGSSTTFVVKQHLEADDELLIRRN